MNQRKQYMKQYTNIKQYERSIDIFPKQCFSHGKSFLTHAVHCISAFLIDHTEINIPSYQDQINMCQAYQVLHLGLLMQRLSQCVKTVKSMNSFMYGIDDYVVTIIYIYIFFFLIPHVVRLLLSFPFCIKFRTLLLAYNLGGCSREMTLLSTIAQTLSGNSRS